MPPPVVASGESGGFQPFADRCRGVGHLCPGLVKVFVLAIIGIGDIFPCPARYMIEQKRKPRIRARWTKGCQIAEILIVQRNDMVKIVKIGRRHLPRPQMTDINAVAGGYCLRPLDRRLACRRNR